jgi:hypothetical protein
MKRIVLVALAVAALGSLAAPGFAGAQTEPTLTLEEACTTFDGTRLVGIEITVSGVPAFSTVSGAVFFPDGGSISGSIFADENGVATITFFSGPGLYTVRVDSPFSAVESLEVDCLPNNKDECRDGGWQTFGVFKNQGDCVSFVATGGKNPPAGGP